MKGGVFTDKGDFKTAFTNFYNHYKKLGVDKDTILHYWNVEKNYLTRTFDEMDKIYTVPTKKGEKYYNPKKKTSIHKLDGKIASIITQIKKKRVFQISYEKNGEKAKSDKLIKEIDELKALYKKLVKQRNELEPQEPEEKPEPVKPKKEEVKPAPKKEKKIEPVKETKSNKPDVVAYLKSASLPDLKKFIRNLTPIAFQNVNRPDGLVKVVIKRYTMAKTDDHANQIRNLLIRYYKDGIANIKHQDVIEVFDNYVKDLAKKK